MSEWSFFSSNNLLSWVSKSSTSYFAKSSFFSLQSDIEEAKHCRFVGSGMDVSSGLLLTMVNILARIAYLCPIPQNPENVILPCFSRLFLRFFGTGSTCFVVRPRNYLKTVHSAWILKKLDLKCLKLSKIGLKLHNFPIFWGKFLATWAYFCPVFQISQK